MTETALKTIDLSFSFAEKPVLRSLSFSLCAGEYIALMGANGAGKSTLLKCLAGVLPFQSGEAELFGKNFRDYSRKEQARLIAYVPQSLHFSFPYKVSEFLLVNRYPHMGAFSFKSAVDDEALQHAMELSDTGNFADALVTELSGGEQQRVLIAAALVQEPKILLLDEPLSALDPRYQQDIRALLQKLKQELGIAVLSATHDLNGGPLMADRILALKAGELVFEGAPAEFMQTEVLKTVYAKELKLIKHPEREFQIFVPG